jgi:ketosteroid isomerase-like protein
MAENVALVREALDALGRRDLPGMLAVAHEDAELNPLITVWPQPYRGHAGIEQWWNDLGSMWQEFSIEVEDIRDLDDDVLLATVEWSGTPQGAGTPLTGWAAAIVRIADDKLIGLDMHLDERRALAAFEKTR